MLFELRFVVAANKLLRPHRRTMVMCVVWEFLQVVNYYMILVCEMGFMTRLVFSVLQIAERMFTPKAFQIIWHVQFLTRLQAQ